jgi:hypothetical protein
MLYDSKMLKSFPQSFAFAHLPRQAAVVYLLPPFTAAFVS